MNENKNLNVAQATNSRSGEQIYLSGQLSAEPLPMGTNIKCRIVDSHECISFDLHVGDLPFNCEIKVKDVNGINGAVFEAHSHTVASYYKNGKLKMSFKARAGRDYSILLLSSDTFEGNFTLSVTPDASVEDVNESLKQRAIEDARRTKNGKIFVADPVDVSTGAHVIQNNLMQFLTVKKSLFPLIMIPPRWYPDRWV